MTEDERQKLDIDWLKTIGGALAAVSSAVLLSTLGAAGTIIGAALGSVIVTVGGAVYSHGLAQSRARLAEAQTLALRKVGVAQAEVRRASRRQGDDPAVDAHLAHADEQLDEAKEDLDDEALLEAPDPGGRGRFAGLPWRRISLLAAAVFATALITITAFELVAGQSVSSITGGTDGDDGTTISRIGDGADDDATDDRRDDDAPDDAPASPDDEATPSEEPSTEESPAEDPSEEPSESPSESTTPSPLTTTVPTEPTPSASEG